MRRKRWLESAKLEQAAGDTATVQLAGLAYGQESTDAWTAKAQAYFAQNGPAPAPPADAAQASPQITPSNPGYQAPESKTLMAALLAVYDNSGKTSLQDQISSYQTLGHYTTNDHSYGVARTAIVMSLDSYAFMKRAINLEEAVHGIGDAPRDCRPPGRRPFRVQAKPGRTGARHAPGVAVDRQRRRDRPRRAAGI
jgi:hypothetical protein